MSVIGFHVTPVPSTLRMLYVKMSAKNTPCFCSSVRLVLLTGTTVTPPKQQGAELWDVEYHDLKQKEAQSARAESTHKGVN